MTRVNNQGVASEDYVADPALCSEVRWRSKSGRRGKLAFQCRVRAGWCVVYVDDEGGRRYELRRAPVEGHPIYCLRHARDARWDSVRGDDRVLA